MKDAEITDFVVWFKNIHSADLLRHLNALAPEEELTLLADNIVGPWQRMKSGTDGRPTPGIKPVGPMKKVWSDWFRTRRGERITLRTVNLADDHLAASAALFSEWNSPEDEEAFRDL